MPKPIHTLAHALGTSPCTCKMADVTEARHRGEPTWFETTERLWWHFLEVLPPIYFHGGFFVSEPADHTPAGIPIYSALVQRGSRYFIRELPANATDAAMDELNYALVVR